MTATVVTLKGSEAKISDEGLAEFRMTIRGDVLTPHDAGYALVRPAYNAMHPENAALVVRPTGTADVISAVNFARENGLIVAIRGGGHSVSGLSSVDGGLLIDLALMNAVDVDPEARTVRVQGGALVGDMDHETQAFGLVTPCGIISDTGVAGLTLGGGEGWLRRKHGMSVDNLLSAQVVCADGQVRTASADSNPDLFWAIRGGGGNFGVVTSFTFSVPPRGSSSGVRRCVPPRGGRGERVSTIPRLGQDGARRDLGVHRMHDASGERTHAARDPQHAVHRHGRRVLR